jgi:hypothetical protein
MALVEQATNAQESELRMFISALSNAVNRFDNLRDRIANGADRLMGAQPASAGQPNPALASVPGSLIAELNSRLNRFQEILGAAEEHVSRIERAV